MSASEDYIKKLTEELARSEAEKQALVEEFKESIPEEWTPDDLKDKVRDLLAKAYARISQTIDSDNENLAYRAAKDVFDIGIGRIQITDDNDPNKQFADFLTSMKPKTEEEKILEKLVADKKQEMRAENGTISADDNGEGNTTTDSK